MVGGAVALIFGAGEAFLLKGMLFSFTSGNCTKAAALMLIKLMLYFAAALLLVFVFSEHIIPCVIGYAIGLPAAVTVWFILYATGILKKSGDDKNENNIGD